MPQDEVALPDLLANIVAQPEDEDKFEFLESSILNENLGDDSLRHIEEACGRLQQRGRWDAAARLLEAELFLAYEGDDEKKEQEVLYQIARLQIDHLNSSDKARLFLRALLDLEPSHEDGIKIAKRLESSDRKSQQETTSELSILGEVYFEQAWSSNNTIPGMGNNRTEFDVTIRQLRGTKPKNSKGKLFVDKKGVSLEFEKNRNGLIAYESYWQDLRRFRHDLSNSYIISACFGEGDIEFEIERNSSAAFENLLKDIPPDSYADRCAYCDGPVYSGRCKECNESQADHQQKRGRSQMATGVFFLLSGIIGTFGSYALTEPGEEYTIGFGAIIFGLVLLATGNVTIKKSFKAREIENKKFGKDL